MAGSKFYGSGDLSSLSASIFTALQPVTYFSFLSFPVFSECVWTKSCPALLSLPSQLGLLVKTLTSIRLCQWVGPVNFN